MKKAPPSAEHDVLEAIRILRERGYAVKKQVQTTKKTFEVSVETLHRFRRVQETLGYKLKDAIEEALSRWLEENEPKCERVERIKSSA